MLWVVTIAGCGGGGDGGGGGPGGTMACATIVDIAPDSSTSGALQVGDCTVEALFPGSGDSSLLDQYRVTLTSQGTLTLALNSVAFDSFLALFSDLQQAPIATDDDSGGGGNALISLSLGAGTYIVLANSALSTPITGAYTLTSTLVPQVWQPTSLSSAPEARTEHTAVWTGSEMIVWGGNDGNAIAKNSGARFDPATNVWTPIQIAGVPTARWGHTAVWTGTEMIVWGGFGGAPDFQPIGDGAKYNPQTNSWTPLPALNQPAPRLSHTAVWTGTEMVVWGGFSCTACASPELDTGARYDPVNNTWTPTATSALASARGNHTAVWTGSRMIVWGGENGAGLLDTGALYDPVANGWAATSATNAPAARRCHSAVWTASEMIVFGGQTDQNLPCGTSSAATGARYDPSFDTWNATAAAPVSSTISNAPTVWTGTQMLAWFGDGARYNLVSNTWNGISATGAPAGRRRHTLVWTGSNAVVWGGDFAGPLNTGGIYNPAADGTP